MAHLSPVVIDNDGAVLLIHGDCAHVALPCGQAEQRLGLRKRAVINSPSARSAPASAPSESTDPVLSVSPARAMARDDLPTPFCPSRAILRGPSGLLSAAGLSSKAGLKLMGEADGPTAPDVQSQSSWTASSLLSWCLMGRGVLPLRTVEALGSVILSYCRRNVNAH